MLQRQLSHLNGRRLDHRQVSLIKLQHAPPRKLLFYYCSVFNALCVATSTARPSENTASSLVAYSLPRDVFIGVPFFSTNCLRNVSPSDKYLMRYAQNARRNACTLHVQRPALTEIGIFQRILVTFPNTKCHENLFSRSRVVICGWVHMTELMGGLLQIFFINARQRILSRPKN
jgi:hypothetical protein